MIDEIGYAALAARGICIPIFFGMVALFRRRYKEQKSKFFMGYLFFFLVIAAIQIGVFIFDILGYFFPETGLSELSDARFADWDESYKESLWLVSNLVRPSYILIIIVLCFALACQVQPLEIISGNKTHLFSRPLFICSAILWLIYIPSPLFRYSLLTVILLSVSMSEICLGFAYNIFISIKLAIKTTGIVRKRSLSVLFGFIMYIIGMLWSAKTGWSEFFISHHQNEFDVIFGSILVIIAALLYYIGFRKSTAV